MTKKQWKKAIIREAMRARREYREAWLRNGAYGQWVEVEKLRAMIAEGTDLPESEWWDEPTPKEK